MIYKKNIIKGLITIVLATYIAGCSLSPKPEPLPPQPTIQETYGLEEQTLNLGPDFAGENDASISVSKYEISFTEAFPNYDRQFIFNPVKNVAIRKNIYNDTTEVVQAKYYKGADFKPHKYDPYVLTLGRMYDNIEDRIDRLDKPNAELKKIQKQLVEHTPEILTQFNDTL